MNTLRRPGDERIATRSNKNRIGLRLKVFHGQRIVTVVRRFARPSGPHRMRVIVDGLDPSDLSRQVRIDAGGGRFGTARKERRRDKEQAFIEFIVTRASSGKVRSRARVTGIFVELLLHSIPENQRTQAQEQATHACSRVLPMAPTRRLQLAVSTSSYLRPEAARW